MRYYLYTFIDTIDGHKLNGLKAFTEIEKDMELTRIKKKFKNGGTICFGEENENEYEYETLREVLNKIQFKEIHNIQYTSINELLFNCGFGHLGPINCDPEDERCENCGEILDECDQTLCDSCQEEEERDEWENSYNKTVRNIVSNIKKEFNLEESDAKGSLCAYFSWKPTNKTQIEISIAEYDDSGDGEVEINLKYNNKDIGYECFDIDEVEKSFKATLKETLNNFLEKSRTY